MHKVRNVFQIVQKDFGYDIYTHSNIKLSDRWWESISYASNICKIREYRSIEVIGHLQALALLVFDFNWTYMYVLYENRNQNYHDFLSPEFKTIPCNNYLPLIILREKFSTDIRVVTSDTRRYSQSAIPIKTIPSVKSIKKGIKKMVAKIQKIPKALFVWHKIGVPCSVRNLKEDSDPLER